MPIASGLLAAGLVAGGSALSASSQKKAASKAADTSLAVAQQNNALARDIYAQNKQALDPYSQRGNVAGNALMDFYGLTPQPAQTLPTPQPNALAQFQGPNPDTSALSQSGRFTAPHNVETIGGDVPWFYRARTDYTAPQTAVPQAPGALGASTSADAFKRYIQNSDYAFQFGQGANAVNSGYAGAGTLQSGAAMKALEDYRQNLQAGYRNEWANGVANQQGVGLGAASALAGVGQNYVNTISNNNNNAGTAAANAALAKGNNNPFAAGLGALGGGILGMGR